MSRATIPKKAGPTVGDLDFAYLTSDQSGWYRLNGRAVNTLPTVAQANAVALGFAVNLPNGADRIVREQGAMGAVGGAIQFAVAANNIPLINLDGTTPLGGTHDHDVPNAPFLGTTGNPGSTRTQNQTSILPAAIGISGALINNTHAHTFTATLQSQANIVPVNTPIELRQPYRAMNLFVYLG